MSDIVINTLSFLGATDIENREQITWVGPTTEQQFNTLQFKSEKPITWAIYQKTEKQIVPTIRDIQMSAAKDIYTQACLRALKQSDYLMEDSVFSTLENGQDWITYRNLLQTSPDTMNYKSLLLTETQLDFQKCVAPPPPPILKKSAGKP